MNSGTSSVSKSKFLKRRTAFAFQGISLGMQGPIFMKVFTNKDKYPFEFYCNATGDLFIPDTDPNGTPHDLKDMSELPYPQSLRLWRQLRRHPLPLSWAFWKTARGIR